MAINRNKDLEIEKQAFKEDLTFYRVQMIILMGLIIFLISALLGSTGLGLLGKTVEGEKNNIWIEYDKFLRKHGDSAFVVNISPPTFNRMETSISISRDYLKHFYIKQILPQPMVTILNQDNIIFVFQINPDNPAKIQFTVEAEEMGYIKGVVKVYNKEMLLRQFIYP